MFSRSQLEFEGIRRYPMRKRSIGLLAAMLVCCVLGLVPLDARQQQSQQQQTPQRQRQRQYDLIASLDTACSESRTSDSTRRPHRR